MSEQEWAEGSGSTWESLDGDPRIVAGAEVLVGRQREINCGGSELPWQRAHSGRRDLVHSTSFGTFSRATIAHFADPTESTGITGAYARDFVCLRNADGELTEEGRALEALAAGAAWTIDRPLLLWMERAGIISDLWDSQCRPDPRRLAMALGREETGQIRGAPRGACHR
jgi:hypothetical protein